MEHCVSTSSSYKDFQACVKAGQVRSRASAQKTETKNCRAAVKGDCRCYTSGGACTAFLKGSYGTSCNTYCTSNGYANGSAVGTRSRFLKKQ